MRCFGITHVLLVVISLILTVIASSAQNAPTLRTGDFVRITLPTMAEPVTGTIIQVLPDTLLVRRVHLPRTGTAYRVGDPDLAVSISAIIEAERRLSHQRGTVRGAALGGAIGLIAGSVVGYMSYEPCEPGLYGAGLCTRQMAILGGAVLGTVPGLLLGAAIGSRTIIEQWERVDLQARLSEGTGVGGVMLVVRL